jgi:hypothetical protein
MVVRIIEAFKSECIFIPQNHNHAHHLKQIDHLGLILHYEIVCSLTGLKTDAFPPIKQWGIPILSGLHLSELFHKVLHAVSPEGV